MPIRTHVTPKSIALPLPFPRRLLVYQGGLANVFHVERFELSKEKRGVTSRLYQGDFRTAENICYGAGLAGAIVRTAACNMAGDIALFDWSDDLDAQPFSEKFCAQMWN